MDDQSSFIVCGTCGDLFQTEPSEEDVPLPAWRAWERKVRVSMRNSATRSRSA